MHNKIKKKKKRPHAFSRVTQNLCSDGIPVGPEFNPGKERRTGIKCSLSSCSDRSFVVHILLSLSGDLSISTLRDRPSTKRGNKAMKLHGRCRKPNKTYNVLKTQNSALFARQWPVPSLTYSSMHTN